MPSRIILFVLSLSHMSVHIIMMLIPSMYIHLIDFFSLNASKVGLVFSMASFCFGIGSLPMSFLYNRYGPRKLIAFSQIGIFAAALLVGFSSNIIMFSISNILLGLFASIHHPVSLTLISEVFEKNISKANAFHGVFGSLGVSLGPLISYYALMNYSWHYAFISTAFFNVFLIPLTLKVIPNTEKIDILQLDDFNDSYQNSILKIFFMISFVVGLSFTIFNTFIPSVFNTDFGENSNSIVSAILLTGFLGQILSGYLGDRFDRVKLLSFIFLLLLPLFISIFFVGKNLLVIVSVLLAMIMYSIQPLINSIIKDITTVKIRSVVFGLNFFLMFGLSGLAAYLGGLIADNYSFKLIFPIFALLFPIGILLLYILNDKRKVKIEC
ncbi:MAG: MFS transporter [Candidatus Neomarinimicrobiota bacterium]